MRDYCVNRAEFCDKPTLHFTLLEYGGGITRCLAMCMVIKRQHAEAGIEQWLGKRGKPVKKMRLIPAERAHAIARKLQGTPGVTVSVL